MTKKKILLKIFKWAAFAALAAVASFAVAVAWVSRDLPTVEQIVNRQIPESTKIYDRTGRVLLWEIGGLEKRTVLPFPDIPQSMKDATVAIEDERFYQESAYDARGIVRAVFINLLHGKTVQGGSTITQQLAKNAFLSPERTLTRKIKEMILAVKINRYYTKDEILGLYLNEIPFGPTQYGVESAARSFFGHGGRELTLSESALLSALAKAPSYYSPYGSHTKELFERRKLVLNKMYALGKISKEDLQNALSQPISFQPQSKGILAPHFSMMVQDYLNEKYGEDLVRFGGLSITTTLDWDLQVAAEKAVSEGATRNESLYKGRNAALVAADPKTGQILALVGSRNFFDMSNQGNFNVAADGLRQPGSSLKPFVYLTAFEKGYTPDTVLFDLPTEFAAQESECPAIVDFKNQSRKCFHPANYDNQFRGPTSLRNALAQSINVPAVKLLYLAGMSEVIKNAQNFGLSTLNDPAQYGLSLVLGGGAVRLIDLVGAYGALAAEGVRHAQSMIFEVRDSEGEILESFKDQSAQLVDSQYPRLVNDILTDVDARAQLFHASLPLTTVPGYQVALKTGTSNDYRDAWVVGYTPSLIAGVWAGNNDNSPMQKQGGSILAAVPIWHDFFANVVQKFPADRFTPPDPTAAAKPILSGNWAPDGQAHTILYYLDRRDPAGPPAANPQSDSQFNNWETPVLAWAAQNGGQIATQSNIQNGGVKINFNSPGNNDRLGPVISVLANITSPAGVTSVKLFFNGQLVHTVGGDFGSSYQYSYSFSPAEEGSQNLLEIEAVDRKMQIAREKITLTK